MARLRLPQADTHEWVTPDDLNVAPALLGLPLARPAQRLQAMGVDLLLIGALSALANLWLLLAAALVAAVWLRQTPAHQPLPDAAAPGPADATPGAVPRRRRPLLAAGLLVLLLVLGVQELVNEHSPAGRAAAKAEAAAEAAAETDTEDTVSHAVEQALQRAASASEAGAGAASAPAVSPRETALLAATQALEQRVKVLEAQRSPARETDWLTQWRKRLGRWLDELGLGYGWSIVYFTLWPAWWGGRTPGKALMGLQVVELTGKPMTPMLGLKRYGGYAAGMATGGLGLVQLLWDRNRQAIQDKTAHTVVVDTRRGRRPPEAA